MLDVVAVGIEHWARVEFIKSHAQRRSWAGGDLVGVVRARELVEASVLLEGVPKSRAVVGGRRHMGQTFAGATQTFLTRDGIVHLKGVALDRKCRIRVEVLHQAHAVAASFKVHVVQGTAELV